MYKVETIQAGFLKKTEIDVVKMPRADFLALVDELLEDEGYEALTDQLRPVAETMVRFPMGEWINPERGCGCVVGEYLVATSEVDRQVMAEREGLGSHTVLDMLMDRGAEGDLLKTFGETIDELIREHVRDNLELDDEGWPKPFDAVEVVD